MTNKRFIGVVAKFNFQSRIYQEKSLVQQDPHRESIASVKLHVCRDRRHHGYNTTYINTTFNVITPALLI